MNRTELIDYICHLNREITSSFDCLLSAEDSELSVDPRELREIACIQYSILKNVNKMVDVELELQHRRLIDKELGVAAALILNR